MSCQGPLVVGPQGLRLPAGSELKLKSDMRLVGDLEVPHGATVRLGGKMRLLHDVTHAASASGAAPSIHHGGKLCNDMSAAHTQDEKATWEARVKLVKGRKLPAGFELGSCRLGPIHILPKGTVLPGGTILSGGSVLAKGTEIPDGCRFGEGTWRPEGQNLPFGSIFSAGVKLPIVKVAGRRNKKQSGERSRYSRSD